MQIIHEFYIPNEGKNTEWSLADTQIFIFFFFFYLYLNEMNGFFAFCKKVFSIFFDIKQIGHS